MSLVFFWLASGWHVLLLLLSTTIDWRSGNSIHASSDKRVRKRWLMISLITNLSLLSIFKYLDFLIRSFNLAALKISNSPGLDELGLALPVGISFYTFQTMSYTIDIYRRKTVPYQSFIDFGCYASFFPQLVAGPIERATHLLPQFYKYRQFNYALAVNGCRQILWGFFKKLVIADNCAEFANQIFNNSEAYGGSTLFLGALFFTFQIYGDFSGYSDIAIGTSRLFGFDLMKNFAFPYFSRDIAEFWRRWHISLSTWFRDYVYIPLGGSRGSQWKQVRNVFVIFLISGFWHGANWTFVLWGGLNAIYFLPLLLLKMNRSNLEIVAEGKIFPSIKELIQMGVTFFLTVLAWVSFRAEDISHAWQIYSRIFDRSLFSIPREVLSGKLLMCIMLVLFFVLIEWIGRRREFAIEYLFESYPRWIRWSSYIFIIFLVGMFMQTNETPFIYFQF